MNLKPGKVYDFAFGPGVLHGICEAVDGDTATMKSTTNDERLDVPIADITSESGPGWFALVEEVAPQP